MTFGAINEGDYRRWESVIAETRSRGDHDGLFHLRDNTAGVQKGPTVPRGDEEGEGEKRIVI